MPSFYHFASKSTLKRAHQCAVCGASAGNVVGRFNYIYLAEFDVVQCPECGLASFDPVPDTATTIEGCERCSLLQTAQSGSGQILKGQMRAYRRGGYFARKYMSNLFSSKKALNMLEIGAGSGYFSQGVKYFFPHASVHYNDIVEGKVKQYKKQFECEAEAGEFSKDLFSGKQFDLIIARDLIEHLRNPMVFLKDVSERLSDGGYFFFITPNGRENLWESNQRYLAGAEPQLIHQNHYQFYLPETLDRMLNSVGLEKKIYFKWGLRRHKKGLGHKPMTRFAQIPEFDRNVLSGNKTLSEASVHDGQTAVTAQRPLGDVVSRLYSNIVERPRQKVDYYDYKGHEFFVLAQRKARS